MIKQSLCLIALAGQGRAETNGSWRAGVLFLGCPPVLVGQEAWVGAWLGEDRSAAYTEPSEKSQGTDGSSKSETIDDGSRAD